MFLLWRKLYPWLTTSDIIENKTNKENVKLFISQLTTYTILYQKMSKIHSNENITTVKEVEPVKYYLEILDNKNCHI